MTTQNKSFSFLNSQTSRVAQNYLEGLDSPTSLGIYLCLRHNDHISACSHSIDPNTYLDPEVFGRDYLAAMLLSKFRESPKGEDRLRSERAIKKFWDCEDHLRTSYARFNFLTSGSNVLSNDDQRLQQVYYLAKEKIRKILGSVNCFNVDDCNFGPGSSTSVARHKAHPSQKYVARDVTSGCRFLVDNFFKDTAISIPDLRLEQRESSRVCIVAKNFKSDRVIAIEPDWNIFFQKGIGNAIRRRLRATGLDLNHAASLHEEHARKGSISGDLVTIDLSSASDSISTFLVRFLLPDDWFYMLNSIRTNSIEMDGVVTPLRKFSSMGNGFTFELESLIFFALALSAKQIDNAVGSVSCFGDDIIAPKGCSALLCSSLESAGFRINTDKSFTGGYFRESCGAHYFCGRNVKPFFLRDNLTNDFTKFKTCNAIRLTAYRFYGRRYDDTPLMRSYSTCKRLIRRVFYIPAGYGDGGLICSADESRPSTYCSKKRDVRRYPNCIEGYKVRCLLPNTFKNSCEHEGMYMYKMRSNELLARDLWIDESNRRFNHRYWRELMIPFDTAICSEEVPQTGNQFSTSLKKLSFRIGYIHVPQWSDPELS